MAAPTTWSFTTAVTVGPPGHPVGQRRGPETAAADDASPIELGVLFQAERDGTVTGVRFYKGPGNNGIHVGHL